MSLMVAVVLILDSGQGSVHWAYCGQLNIWGPGVVSCILGLVSELLGGKLDTRLGSVGVLGWIPHNATGKLHICAWNDGGALSGQGIGGGNWCSCRGGEQLIHLAHKLLVSA